MKGPRLEIVGSCAGCEDLRPLRTKRGAVIPAGCAQENGKAVGGYTPAWCPELHAATVAHARAVLAKEIDITPGEAPDLGLPRTFDRGAK